MDGFLTVLHHTSGFTPLRLHPTLDRAERSAERTRPNAGVKLQRLLGFENSTPLAVKIVEYNASIPVKIWTAKSFNDQEVESDEHYEPSGLVEGD